MKVSCMVFHDGIPWTIAEGFCVAARMKPYDLNLKNLLFLAEKLTRSQKQSIHTCFEVSIILVFLILFKFQEAL